MKPRKCNCKNCRYCSERDWYEKNHEEVNARNKKNSKLKSLAKKEVTKKFNSMTPEEVVERVNMGVGLI